MIEQEIGVVSYGLRCMGKALHKVAEADALIHRLFTDSDTSSDWATMYEHALTEGGAASPGQPLMSIFSLIQLPKQPAATPVFCLPSSLTLDPLKRSIFPTTGAIQTEPKGTWTEFESDVVKALLPDRAHGLEVFEHIIFKHGWGIPCTVGHVGASLYDQWKAIATLIRASGESWQNGPATKFSLIGGDIPGIQDFVYTITSKGAAKGLRGRSFFIQLLGDAVIRRLLRDLSLWPTNVVYSAGGNFMLLGPALDQDVKRCLNEAQMDIDSTLLSDFLGDITVSLAWEDLALEQVGSAAFGQEVSLAVKQKIADKKRRRFVDVASSQWQKLFGAHGAPGNRYCDTCRRPQTVGEEAEQRQNPATGEVVVRCGYCTSFQSLAQEIGKERLNWIVDGTPSDDIVSKATWQGVLARVSGYEYRFVNRERREPTDSKIRIYAVNRIDFISEGADGFRLFANTTPRVTTDDVAQWERHPELRSEDEDPPRVGDIRSFSQLADAAHGVSRVGVLRMDVDNLGQIMVGGLPMRNLLATTSLSRMMELFFGGWLAEICKEVNDLHNEMSDRGDRLYIIYAGGDDLFIVGSWDLMPELADRIQKDFALYTGANPSVTISAGITFEDRKFPLYQAAENAGRAEEAAKEYRRAGGEKDAISFLSEPVSWTEWSIVMEQRDKIFDMVNPAKPASQQAPHAFLQVLRDIYIQHRDQVNERQRQFITREWQPGKNDATRFADVIHYGPWMWRQAYALARMAERIKPLANDIEAFKVDELQVEYVRYNGLAARWVELLIRKEGAQ